MRQILLLIAITCDGKITYGNIAINNYLWQKPLLIAAVFNGHSHRRHTARTDSGFARRGRRIAGRPDTPIKRTRLYFHHRPMPDLPAP